MNAAYGQPIKNNDADGNPYTSDEEHKAYVVVPGEHYQIHQGKHFISTSYFTVATANTSTWFLIQVPSTTTEHHMVLGFNASGLSRFCFFEGAAVSTVGAAMNIINQNRRSTNTTTVIITSGPTVTTTGSCMWTGLFGGTSISHIGVPGGGRLEHEFILAPNTNYLFRLLNLVASISAASIFNWYEID